ncbi:hypothetical protein C0J52_04660, partial [Blattella germanica]
DSEDGLLRADLESLYAFTHKTWSPHVVDNEVPVELDRTNRNPRLYVMETEDEESEQNNSTVTTETGEERSTNLEDLKTSSADNLPEVNTKNIEIHVTEQTDRHKKPFSKGPKKDVDPWSLMWYMASFGGLVAFFLIVSCSECCCSKRAANSSNNNNNTRAVEPPPEVTQWVDETPPPPYHLFAPPSYDTLFYGNVTEEKNKCEVFVVPVHSHMLSIQSTASNANVSPT